MKDHEIESLLNHEHPLVRQLVKDHKKLLRTTANVVMDLESVRETIAWATKVLTALRTICTEPYHTTRDELLARVRSTTFSLAQGLNNPRTIHENVPAAQ